MALELETLGRARDFSGILAKNDTFIKYAKELIVNVQKYLAKIDIPVT